MRCFAFVEDATLVCNRAAMLPMLLVDARIRLRRSTNADAENQLLVKTMFVSEASSLFVRDPCGIMRATHPVPHKSRNPDNHNCSLILPSNGCVSPSSPCGKGMLLNSPSITLLTLQSPCSLALSKNFWFSSKLLPPLSG